LAPAGADTPGALLQLIVETKKHPDSGRFTMLYFSQDDQLRKISGKYSDKRKLKARNYIKKCLFNSRFWLVIFLQNLPSGYSTAPSVTWPKLIQSHC
jgi:hypothetical protein